MKKFLLISVCLAGLGLYSFGNNNPEPTGSTEQVVVDNDELRVVEFTSEPGKDVCGKGMHTHDPHLTIVLTDGAVRVTTKDGQSEEYQLNSGTAIWFDADTHKAINSGKGEMKVMLVYLK
jgi:hypothetical protein